MREFGVGLVSKSGRIPNLVKKLLLVSFSMILLMSLVACSDKMEEPDITVDYLKGEYAEQLLTDGAELIVGSVDIVDNDGVYAAKITEKQVVASDKHDKGYYLAETNNLYERVLGSDSRIVYKDGGESVVGDADSFIKKCNGQSQYLYKVYCFSESCELIIAIEPEEALE